MEGNKKRISYYREEIERMRDEGLTHRQIGEKLGYTKMQVKAFAKRERQKQRENFERTLPESKEKTNENMITDPKKMQKEIERLKMENELLRDFLQRIGKG